MKGWQSCANAPQSIETGPVRVLAFNLHLNRRELRLHLGKQDRLMSKIIATSGNQASVLKGTATGEDATADAGTVGLFAALFGGMQLAETEDDAEPTQSNTQTGDTNSNPDLIFDPHMTAMLGKLKKSVPGQVNAASIPNATDDTQTENFEQKRTRPA